MYNESFESKLRTRLLEKGLAASDVEFIMSQIRCGELDENLKIMDNNVYDVLEERGLCMIFSEACNELGFVFTHSIEPER